MAVKWTSGETPKHYQSGSFADDTRICPIQATSRRPEKWWWFDNLGHSSSQWFAFCKNGFTQSEFHGMPVNFIWICCVRDWGSMGNNHFLQ